MELKSKMLKAGLIGSISLLFVFICAFRIVPETNPKFKTFVDPRDGQEYTIVKIGKQWWFAENLNYAVEKSWCSECETYGRMYTYESAFEACPKGWHVPGVEEWNELINNLGGKEIAGGKLKSTDNWKSPNTGADNSSGFSAIPAPERGTNGEIRNPSEATWWTSEKTQDPAAWTMVLKHNSSSVLQMGFYHVSGFSVRCVKD